MKIKKGDKLPDAKVFILDIDPKEVSIKQIIGDEKTILFGLPGAFTPTCSTKHLPGFALATDQLREKDIKKVVCISVNDPFVMDAWGKSQNLKNQITLLADVQGEFTKKIGAEFNWRGWGLRSMRYTMLLENEEIKKIVVEEGKCELTAADNFLKEI
jgi:peroxiredoxin (alkyl hydroperoxide reductase subunit C)